MAKGIEIVFHVVAFLLAIGVLAMICIQAQSIGRSNQTLLTAPSSLQAGYIGLLILYMIYPVFKNQGFRVANADVESVEVVVILLMILIYFKLTVFKDINTTNLAALTIIDGVQSMNTSTAHDLHVHRRQPHRVGVRGHHGPPGAQGRVQPVLLDRHRPRDPDGRLRRPGRLRHQHQQGRAAALV